MSLRLAIFLQEGYIGMKRFLFWPVELSGCVQYDAKQVHHYFLRLFDLHCNGATWRQLRWLSFHSASYPLAAQKHFWAREYYYGCQRWKSSDLWRSSWPDCRSSWGNRPFSANSSTTCCISPSLFPVGAVGADRHFLRSLLASPRCFSKIFEGHSYRASEGFGPDKSLQVDVHRS